MTDAATDLVDFIHPERACYVFGPENGSLSAETIERCERSVRIPTNLSLSLGASVNIVLYDRLAKNRRL
jgi:tRNA(Leu) C34 or U34 (ribose-2'-O)-methylase TrmL